MATTHAAYHTTPQEYTMKTPPIEVLALQIVNYVAAAARLGDSVHFLSPYLAIRSLPQFNRYRVANYDGMFNTAIDKLERDEVITFSADHIALRA